MHGKGLADTQSLSRAGDDEASIYAIGSGAIYSEKYCLRKHLQRSATNLLKAKKQEMTPVTKIPRN